MATPCGAVAENREVGAGGVNNTSPVNDRRMLTGWGGFGGGGGVTKQACTLGRHRTASNQSDNNGVSVENLTAMLEPFIDVHKLTRNVGLNAV